MLVWGPAVQPAFADAEVRPGAVAEVVAAPVRGVGTTLLLPTSAVGVLRWTMPDGSVLRLFCNGERELVRGAAAGRHRVEFVTMSGGAFAAEFDVGEAPPPPVELIATAPR